jgi:glycosyltransferase involved in cell wall biosynthesis
MYYLSKDTDSIQSPDKVVYGKQYWFFKYLPDDIDIDVVDFTKLPIFHYVEKRIFKFYIAQSLRILPYFKNYDIIISHSAQSAVVFAFLRSLIGEKNPPHIVIDPASFNGGRDNFLELLPIKFCARSINGIIYHSKIQYKYYKKHLTFLLDRTQFIPFGVDVDFFKPMDLLVEPYILSFGYLYRDYHTLLRAWKLLDKESVELRIVGINDIGRWKLDSFPKNVKIFPKVPISILKEMIAKALFVVIPLPYYEYSYGQMSLLQSMSMGKAVIVTKTPSTIDYIEDNFDAIGTVPYDEQDLAQKIRKCLDDKDFVYRIGKNARSTVLKKYNEKLMAERIYTFVKSIL